MLGDGGHPSSVSPEPSDLQRSTGLGTPAQQLMGLEGQRVEGMVMEPPSTDLLDITFAVLTNSH